jgi:regulator of sigma E protease
MITILATIFVLGVLVFVHETGHFLSAKMFRMRVDRFSLGYPPRLAGKKIGDTDYCISWIPFGGYVKIAGMVDESLDKKSLAEKPEPWEFRSKPWIQKVIVVAAGSLMNIALAFFIFTAETLHHGIDEISPDSVVGEVMEGKPAQLAGIHPGDRIVRIDGQSVDTWEAMAGIIHGIPGKTVRIEWLRNDSLFSADVTPQKEKIVGEEENKEVGLIGIVGPSFTTRRAGLFEAVSHGAQFTYYLSKLVIVSFGKLITGKESLKSLAGPVLIAKMAGESARSGLETLIAFLALISLNIGILNLFPIPVLDGGHLVFLAVEGVIRREVPIKIKLIVQQAGMVLILGLMVFVIYNDILRIFQK